MPVTGDEIGPYLIVGLIDDGVMASVFRVRDTRDRTTKALKLLHLEDDEARERMLREARAMSELRHPNLVPVLDILEHDGMPGFVMEHVKGLLLDEWINEYIAEGFESVMDSTVNSYTGYLYDAQHAFAQPTTPRYDAGSAALAWQRKLDFLKRHLVI